jgi:hypothetical protein
MSRPHSGNFRRRSENSQHRNCRSNWRLSNPLTRKRHPRRPTLRRHLRVRNSSLHRKQISRRSCSTVAFLPSRRAGIRLVWVFRGFCWGFRLLCRMRIARAGLRRLWRMPDGRPAVSHLASQHHTVACVVASLTNTDVRPSLGESLKENSKKQANKAAYRAGILPPQFEPAATNS